MPLRRSLTAAVAGLTVALALGTLAAPAHADPLDPINALLQPSLFDPIVGALPAYPTPYKPYTGTICRSGSPQCIVDVIAEMQARLVPLAASCSHDAIFSLAYLRVTQNVKAAADNGYFHDRAWLTRIDAVFAQKYFDTMDAWNAGDTAAVPKAWQLALTATRDRTMSGLGDFLMNMNAHINNDFPYVLAQVGLTAADGTTHKPDHNAYNDRLDSLYQPVFDEETARFDPTFNKINIGNVDEVLVGAIMRGWREIVWRHAEALVNAPALLRPVIEQEIADYAATQAEFIKQVFAKKDPSARDAYCALHHG
ncbi:MAG: hypothetical protein JWP74_3026 [Marmoricola sp.]|nr:hypothetical protein [Marmoricola sp.]